MDISRDWLKNEFINQEMLYRHRMVETEFSFYDAIATGNMEFVLENCQKKMFVNLDGVGKLSHDPVQNLKYHFTITAAMIVRYCIQYGMESEKAYSLSDFYILKMDSLTTIEEICKLHDVMSIEICKQMQDLQKIRALSKPIVLCVDYIYSHMHYRITVEELAEHVGLSVSYLSKLFKTETGMALSEYITEIKIEKAKNMLQYSDLKTIDIANYFAFSSQSHFIQVFRKFTGITPYQYRKQNFRSGWNAKN
ncbi:MAG: helix-turn-helix transcriptional regulator [Lachnospiraceae bacterium]|nr:helix-turn-helix transcriptional regulator [Lachnospiraceae bacterium]